MGSFLKEQLKEAMRDMHGFIVVRIERTGGQNLYDLVEFVVFSINRNSR